MKMRVIATIIVLMVMVGMTVSYNQARGPIESSIAVKQLEDDATTYAVASTVAEGHMPFVWNFSGLCILGLVWGPYTYRKIKEL